MALSAREYKKILAIIEIIYAIPDRGLMFRTVCEELQKLIPFPSAALISTDPKSGNFLIPHSYTYNSPFEALMRFCLYYAPLNPIIGSGAYLKIRGATPLTDVVSVSKLAETEYYRDFQARINIFYELCISLKSRRGVIAGIGLHRSRRDRNFTDNEQEVMNILIPHLSRAFQNIDFLQRGWPRSTDCASRLACLNLSMRQQEVAFLVMQGLSNREIALRLYISEQTVKDHLCDIFEKIRIRRRGELTARILGLHQIHR
jgi:DNA-binding CsgD family transcriptional regulator